MGIVGAGIIMPDKGDKWASLLDTAASRMVKIASLMAEAEAGAVDES